MVATRFTSYIDDTLRSVQISFNDSYRDANKRSFDLLVWSDNNGTPGDVIYRGEELMVTQAGRINGFYTYVIPDGVPVNGVFYIGWKQRSETFLNAGVDINTAQNGKQFYWLNGNWQQSQVKGTLMIRPVVGAPPKTTSIDDLYGTKDYEIKITPNPAREFIKVTTAQSDNGETEWISITDLNGRKLLTSRNSGQIDISSLHQGIYIVITSISGRPTGYSRLIKVK
jgi:hypothetical protein